MPLRLLARYSCFFFPSLLYPDDPVRSLAEKRRIVAQLEGMQEDAFARQTLLAQHETYIATGAGSSGTGVSGREGL